MRALALALPLLVACGNILGLDDYGPRDGQPAIDADAAAGGAAPAGAGGAGGAAPRAPARVVAFGGADDDALTAFAADPAGGVILAGTIGGAVSFGGPSLGVPGVADTLFVAGLDDTGRHRFSLAASGARARAYDAAVGPLEGAVVVGAYELAPLELGGLTLASADASDGFVARIGAEGAVTDLMAISGPGEQLAAAVALRPDGSLVVVGTFSGAIESPTSLTSSGGRDVFVFAVSASGSLLWAKRWGDGQDQRATAVAVGEDGSIYVAGELEGALEPVPLQASAEAAAFVVGLDAAGEVKSAFEVGASGRAEATALAIGEALVVGGTFTGSLALNESIASMGGRDGFVMGLDPGDLSPRWSWAFGGASLERVDDLSAWGASAVVAAASDSASVVLGDSGHHGQGDLDALVVGLDDGGFAWGLGFGRQERDAVQGIWRGESSLVAAGTFGDVVELGGQLLHSAGGTDIFLVAWQP